jgi:cystathionine beta-synthase
MTTRDDAWTREPRAPAGPADHGSAWGLGAARRPPPTPPPRALARGTRNELAPRPPAAAARVATSEPRTPRPLTDTLGWTPVVRLSRISQGLPCTPLAKCAFMSPPGALDARAAMDIVRRAEASARARPGDTLVVPTRSGNLLGLAMAAAASGYQLVVTAPLDVDIDPAITGRDLGVRIIRTPADVAPGSHTGFIGVARRLSQTLPDAHLVRSWAVPSAASSPDSLVARELVQQCGELDVVIVAAATAGASEGLAQAIGSVRARARIVEVVIGAERAAHRAGAIERWQCGLADATAHAGLLARSEGLLVGPRAGAAMWAALRVCSEHSSSHTVVAILADGVESEPAPRPRSRAEAARRAQHELATVLDILGEAAAEAPIVIGPDDSVGTALHLFRRHQVSYLPVVVAGRLVGVIGRSQVMRHRVSGDADARIDAVMSTEVATVRGSAAATEAFAALARHGVAVVIDALGGVVGVITAAELVGRLARAETE